MNEQKPSRKNAINACIRCAILKRRCEPDSDSSQPCKRCREMKLKCNPKSNNKRGPKPNNIKKCAPKPKHDTVPINKINPSITYEYIKEGDKEYDLRNEVDHTSNTPTQHSVVNSNNTPTTSNLRPEFCHQFSYSPTNNKIPDTYTHSIQPNFSGNYYTNDFHSLSTFTSPNSFNSYPFYFFHANNNYSFQTHLMNGAQISNDNYSFQTHLMNGAQISNDDMLYNVLSEPIKIYNNDAQNIRIFKMEKTLKDEYEELKVENVFHLDIAHKKFFTWFCYYGELTGLNLFLNTSI
ncbi:11825_t:CDS:2 [Dentiscutata erythropus]|uniref:11825_t:CDS:1 n=1 Tax=Dentiscutata erythropus TaxID=1348616 RepID=A0A9N9N2A8_9GLOM|nr:11825_t:CDS:2 [Dentiscutata erythropus]